MTVFATLYAWDEWHQFLCLRFRVARLPDHLDQMFQMRQELLISAVSFYHQASSNAQTYVGS